jgi:hypothetical protein
MSITNDVIFKGRDEDKFREETDSVVSQLKRNVL